MPLGKEDIMGRNFKKLTDGRYVYYYWDEEKKVEMPYYLVPSENEATDELIVTLDDFDRKEKNSERREEDHADYSYRNYLVRASRGDGKAVNPLDVMAEKKWAAEQESEGHDYSPMVDVVREIMGCLTDEQVKLIYAVYGEKRKQKEIAEQIGKTPQAINNRLKKIKARIAKIAKEKGLFL
jgi:RNA polymerase sigma factor (sigma-70 family)